MWGGEEERSEFLQFTNISLGEGDEVMREMGMTGGDFAD